MEESNPEYEKLKHYIFELEDHLAEAQKQAYRLVKRHRGSRCCIVFVMHDSLFFSSLSISH